ncbi:MAG: hypothetical protein GX770_08710 [Firmicutes bacterium]|nr:hypothetical protein [Bacillota bacterium]
MLSDKLLFELQLYIERHQNQSAVLLYESVPYYQGVADTELEEFVKRKRKPSFQQLLFQFIDAKGEHDSAVYKKVGLDRRHFSKIRSNPDYHPGKNTVLALAIALELNKEETSQLLAAAGYSLSESDTFDLVIQFCLEKKIYNLDTINQALDYFSLKPLAGVN